MALFGHRTKKFEEQGITFILNPEVDINFFASIGVITAEMKDEMLQVYEEAGERNQQDNSTDANSTQFKATFVPLEIRPWSVDFTQQRINWEVLENLLKERTATESAQTDKPEGSLFGRLWQRLFGKSSAKSGGGEGASRDMHHSAITPSASLLYNLPILAVALWKMCWKTEWRGEDVRALARNPWMKRVGTVGFVLEIASVTALSFFIPVSWFLFVSFALLVIVDFVGGGLVQHIRKNGTRGSPFSLKNLSSPDRSYVWMVFVYAVAILLNSSFLVAQSFLDSPSLFLFTLHLGLVVVGGSMHGWRDVGALWGVEDKVFAELENGDVFNVSDLVTKFRITESKLFKIVRKSNEKKLIPFDFTDADGVVHNRYKGFYQERSPETGAPTGKLMSFPYLNRNGNWIASSTLILISPSGRILFQKRKGVEGDGLLDWSAGGHVEPGDEPMEAAIKEGNEELPLKKVGIKLNASNVVPLNINESGENSKKFLLLRETRSHQGPPKMEGDVLVVSSDVENKGSMDNYFSHVISDDDMDRLLAEMNKKNNKLHEVGGAVTYKLNALFLNDKSHEVFTGGVINLFGQQRRISEFIRDRLREISKSSTSPSASRRSLSISFVKHFWKWIKRTLGISVIVIAALGQQLPGQEPMPNQQAVASARETQNDSMASAMTWLTTTGAAIATNNVGALLSEDGSLHIGHFGNVAGDNASERLAMAQELILSRTFQVELKNAIKLNLQGSSQKWDSAKVDQVAQETVETLLALVLAEGPTPDTLVTGEVGMVFKAPTFSGENSSIQKQHYRAAVTASLLRYGRSTKNHLTIFVHDGATETIVREALDRANQLSFHPLSVTIELRTVNSYAEFYSNLPHAIALVHPSGFITENMPEKFGVDFDAIFLRPIQKMDWKGMFDAVKAALLAA